MEVLKHIIRTDTVSRYANRLVGHLLRVICNHVGSSLIESELLPFHLCKMEFFLKTIRILPVL